ncbi:MAG: UpxY family transcription antiterminator [Cytophagales bacterium]|nr:UpxY family transcription antiterminator [Cytophagales bacterium]
MNWYVLYTKSHQEKKVAIQLSEMGYEVFCPCVKKLKQWSDRKKVIEEPLFKSYVFIRTEAHKRERAFDAYGVVRYLFWLQKPAIVKDEEIAAIRDLLGEFVHSEIEVVQLEREDRVRIKSGPMVDKEGVVQKVDQNYIEVLIEALQVKIKVDIRNNKVAKLQTR